jgi:hypothetical protein
MVMNVSRTNKTVATPDTAKRCWRLAWGSRRFCRAPQGLIRFPFFRTRKGCRSLPQKIFLVVRNPGFLQQLTVFLLEVSSCTPLECQLNRNSGYLG